MLSPDDTDTTTVRDDERQKNHHFDAPSQSGAGMTSRRGALQLLAGGALSGLLVHPGLARAARQETDRHADRDDEPLSPEALKKIVQFVHPEKVYNFLPGLDEELLAALYGLDVATYRAMRQQFNMNAREAAQDLLSDPAFARRVDQLPIRPGETVIGVGESRTDDLQSWLDIFRHLLDLRQPDDRISVINNGIEGSTTGDGLKRFVPNTVLQQPDWIICCLGAADAVRFGRQPTKTLVSLDETAKNMVEMRHLAATQTDAQWVWIIPHTVNEQLAAEWPPFQRIQFTLHNEDLIAIGNLLRGHPAPGIDVHPVRQADPVVDPRPVFGRSAPPHLVLQDGIHTSLAGQQAVAKVLVETLTAETSC